MKINKTLALLVVICAAYAASTGSMYGQISPAVQPLSGVTIYANAATKEYNLGFVFTPQHSITVNALGFYDETGANGTTGSESVGIYDSVGNLLTSATVGLSDLVDSYYWQTIAPLTLSAGSTYTVDAYYNGVNSWGSTASAGSSYIGVNSAITFVNPVYTSTLGGLVDPTTVGTGNYLGPNFSIVPDGGLTVLLLGMGLTGLGCIRRKLA